MTKVFAHRGSKGTHPENTMAAFKEALRVGAEGIELDVQQTKDGKLAVIHDETVDRTTNGSGYVHQLTLAELQELDAGSWFDPAFKGEKIPSLPEVLAWLKETDLILNIEIKHITLEDTGLEEAVIQAVKEQGLEKQVIISSFNHDALKKINDLYPEFECGILYMERLYQPWNYAKTLGSTGLHAYYIVVDPSLIENAQEHGIAVRAYTVNNEEHMKHFFLNGIDAIITDFPAKALQIRGDKSNNEERWSSEKDLIRKQCF